MNLSWIDWAIVVVFTAFLMGLAIYAKRFNKGVADFLVANRCAGRYLLSISQGIAAIGAISFVATFQKYYAAGFSALWWMFLMGPIGLFVSLSGWIIYRYRETRVLTMAQFFEVRYSRRFRVFTGVLAWVSGVVNMGIFPAVTARLFIHFCGLPATFSLFGIDGFSTYVTIMLIELSIALAFTFLGGMIVIMITDFLQGIFCNIAFLLILIFLLTQFEWGSVIEALQTAPENASMLNPFKTSKAAGFNTAYFIMYILLTVYNLRAWQGTQGYNAAAINAHESKMAGIIGGWRSQIQLILLLMIPLFAFTIMNHVNFTSEAAAIQQVVDGIGSETIQKQMLVPVVLSQMLPVGLMGLFVAVMFAAAISSDDTYLHSWGSIFVQDVVLPFRKKPFTPKQHTRMLRASILFVAVFIFFFSLLFEQNDYILMFMHLTGAIYLGGAGAVIVGGLYWKRGTTAGAWCAMLIGSGLAVFGLLIRSIWTDVLPTLQNWFPDSAFLAENTEAFPYNGMQISFAAAICAIISYITVSLLSGRISRKPPFNMNRMLHRGEYALKGEHGGDVVLPPTGLKAILPSKEFSRSDKVLYYILMGWIFMFFLIFVGVTLYHFIWGTTEAFWIKYWTVWTGLIVVIGTLTTVWFLIGGLVDTKKLFRTLKTTDRNITDDGRVSGHHNVEDEVREKDNPEVVEELKNDSPAKK